MAMSKKRIDDVETLRAFAHPLRMKLLGKLRLDGPATASELGRHLGESSGSTSYHLRQLERFGFVAEDEQQPSRRERRWRAAHDLTSWRTSDFADSEAGSAATAVIRQYQMQNLIDEVREWETEEWNPDWLDASEHSDMPLFLRAEDVRALANELLAVIRRYTESPRPDDDPEAARVLLHLLTIPSKGGTA